MNTRVLLLLVVGGGLFGAFMKSLAVLASRPGAEWIQWVVNWGALWLAVPFACGCIARTRSGAVVTGALAAVIEVAVYYGPGHPAPFKLGWMFVGAVFAAGAGAVGWSRASPRARFIIPALMVVEPLAWTVLFAALGRSWSTGLWWSGAVEMSMGLVALTLMRGRRADQAPLERHHARKLPVDTSE